MLVYIREAHAIDSAWPMLDGPLIEDPVSNDERQHTASECVQELGLDMIPAVIDRVDDEVNQAYAGWPDRLFLVGKDGKIAYSGGRGPFGFKPDELEAAMEKELAAHRKASDKQVDKQADKQAGKRVGGGK